MGQPQLPGRGPEILANLLRHPGGCCGVVTWSCAARTRHVSDLFLAGGAGWLLAAAMQDLDCRMLTERTVSIKCVFLSSTIPCKDTFSTCAVQLYSIQNEFAENYGTKPVVLVASFVR